jgi:hypothetical protein
MTVGRLLYLDALSILSRSVDKGSISTKYQKIGLKITLFDKAELTQLRSTNSVTISHQNFWIRT